MRYLANMTVIFGMDVARAAWDVSDLDYAGLLTGEHSPATLNDVRSQFARWASNAPSRAFRSLADAWNAFAAPKLGRPHPLVLLPASACHRCANARGLAGVRTDPECVLCGGTGRRKPSALVALMATELSFSDPAAVEEAEVAETEGLPAAVAEEVSAQEIPAS